MAITNPERVATKQDLKDFYDIIFPYLGGNSEAGFTPIGTIIAVMGNSAPTNYLACNGQVVNIADYPELANYFLAQFGSRNKFGGNGTTTFGIPDLRGEFLRGSGTNSHSGQGSGSNVGTHQDGTTFAPSAIESGKFALVDKNSYSSWHWVESNTDKITTQATAYVTQVGSASQFTQQNNNVTFTARPTNTSVLYCIATKNIYMNPALDYTTEEKVVGQWINGKSIYQKTLTGSYTGGSIEIDLGSGIDKIVYLYMYGDNPNGGFWPIPYVDYTNKTNDIEIWGSASGSISGHRYIKMRTQSSGYSNMTYYATVRYTKTT